MIELNCIIIHGRLARDTEINFYNGDKSVCKFSVAVNRAFKDKDGNYVADFFNCVSFGKQGEMIDKFFHKGDGISVQGEMQNNKYVDKDGNNRDGWQIKVNSFDWDYKGKGKGEAGGTAPSKGENEGFYPIEESPEDEDLPF
ncbi:MAG: single-stranded DNA-binding protein [Anaerotignaceae bacterium]